MKPNTDANINDYPESMLPIDKDIPMPSFRSAKVNYVGGSRVFPFGRMKIGDSFACPENLVSSAGAVATSQKSRYGRIFIRRKLNGVVRFWRVY